MKNRKILISALGIVVALILGIAVAYAALSSTLNAKFNSVTVGNATWDVEFINDWNGTEGTPSDSVGVSCGWATISKNSVTTDNIMLSKPGDSCSYSIHVSNKGTIAAKITSIIANEPEGITCEKSESEDKYTMVCGNITYDISSSTHTPLHEKIDSTSYESYYMKVTYTGTSVMPIIHSNPGFTFVFGQA